MNYEPGTGPQHSSQVRASRHLLGRSRDPRSRSFCGPMTDMDLARSRAELDLVTYTTPGPGVSGTSPGVVPLASWSGLFLERGEDENQWILKDRSRSNPPDSAIHEWDGWAGVAAPGLDPSLKVPARARNVGPRSQSHPPSRAETSYSLAWVGACFISNEAPIGTSKNGTRAIRARRRDDPLLQRVTALIHQAHTRAVRSARSTEVPSGLPASAVAPRRPRTLAPTERV